MESLWVQDRGSGTLRQVCNKFALSLTQVLDQLCTKMQKLQTLNYNLLNGELADAN